MMRMRVVIITATVYWVMVSEPSPSARTLCSTLSRPSPSRGSKGSSLEPWSSAATGRCLGTTGPHVPGVISNL